jgi:hypothetical protein
MSEIQVAVALPVYICRRIRLSRGPDGCTAGAAYLSAHAVGGYLIGQAGGNY